MFASTPLRVWRPPVRLLALAALWAALAAPVSALPPPQDPPQLKAAYLLSFARFTDWPPGDPTAPLMLCVAGDDAVATALGELTKGQNVNGRPVESMRVADPSRWRACQVLFVASSEARRSSAGLSALRALPVLTVSDKPSFAQTDGIIELFFEDRGLRFAIHVEAATRSGLRLSARLLKLAKIVKDSHD